MCRTRIYLSKPELCTKATLFNLKVNNFYNIFCQKYYTYVLITQKLHRRIDTSQEGDSIVMCKNIIR